MQRNELNEIHYITHIGNLRSIIENGILCNTRASALEHITVASKEVQQRRANKKVPGGMGLHDYANLYLNGRNPMLYSLIEKHAKICILSVSTDVLDLPNIVITDQNAARTLAGFFSVDEGLARVDTSLLYAQYWTHRDDLLKEDEHKGMMCAEVLVPEYVPPDFIRNVYVSNEGTKTHVVTEGCSLTVKVEPYLFFL